jgi:hypothetical protein
MLFSEFENNCAWFSIEVYKGFDFSASAVDREAANLN